MKITTLIENTACREGLVCEHGLSLYIETGSKRILFDAGQTGAFGDNAEKLGIDLSRVDLAVLSHGHYDHGGGLKRFLELNAAAPVYINQSAFSQCYNGPEKYIGLAPSLRESDRLVFVEDQMELGEGLTLLSCNDRPKVVPVNPFGLNIRENGVTRPDDFRHEQYLLIRENGKTVCISGCSHKGILNIVDWLRPDVLVGGFHFMKLDPAVDGDALRAAAGRLLSYPTRYYTGHCTGEAQFAFLKERMGDRLQSISTGSVIEL